MSIPVWTNVTVKLGDLQPWEHNPRTMTKRQAQRLVKSRNTLGQFQTVAIGPNGEVYDGHQRLNAWAVVYGMDSSIDARQSDRPLNDDERAALTLAANLPAGAWDWGKLAQWDAGAMADWGMDEETLATWNNDANNLRQMINADFPPLDPMAEWEGMPEFEQEDNTAWKSITVHFDSPDNMQNFAELIEQTITEKTKSIWYPKKEKSELLDYVITNES